VSKTWNIGRPHFEGCLNVWHLTERNWKKNGKKKCINW
jgi:hypothetical protein